MIVFWLKVLGRSAVALALLWIAVRIGQAWGALAGLSAAVLFAYAVLQHVRIRLRQREGRP